MSFYFLRKILAFWQLICEEGLISNLENRKLEAILISKKTGYLEFSLENGNLKKCVRNW